LAITTRILRLTIGEYTSVKLRVVGCSPAWPNPGGAQSGYLIEGPGRLLLDCGPGVLARLREEAGGWPDVDAIVITHWHLDHWGDLVPWVWGSMSGPGRDEKRPELWLPPQGTARLEDFGTRLGWEDMFSTIFKQREYSDADAFEAAGMEVTAFELPHYTLQTFGLRVSNGDTAIAYSGDTGPSDRLAELARDADLFICEATLERPEYDGAIRGHLAAEEAVAAFEASGARRLLLTHRPRELTLDGYELAHDGLEIEV
jgi:ribonuclease BN (tRNA processing enzyme)